jgi:hypothetical protein
MKQVSRALLVLLLFAAHAFAFGQNKVQYERKQWSFIQTDHFDIYYYEGGYDQAVFTAEVADSAYKVLVRDYDWELPAEQRITIITYQSHNDFSNTNLTWGVVPESVGGFTEFYKNRVVVPFQGSWEAYRHVVHHELNHAFQLHMFYGEQILSGVIRFPLPLWFVEGTSEYTSRNGWDREANMFMADAVVSGYLPDIPWLGGFLAYKGGQSVFCYLEDTFGRQKFSELMHRVRSQRSIERGIESTLGFGLEELSRNWKQYLQRIYWPTIEERVRAGEFADRITDHLKLNNFVNNSPAISPAGDRMVYLTDRSGYFDLYLANITRPEKPRLLLKGQQSGAFEELHWLRPGISWAPDGDRLVFAGKAGEEDELYLIDADRGKVLESWAFGLKGLYSPTFSPDGRHVAFVAQLEARSDIWLLDLEDESIQKVTDDRYSDFDPCFSADGRSLLFTSDRGADISRDSIFVMKDRDYAVHDVYQALLEMGDTDDLVCTGLIRLTDSPYDKRTPVWLSASSEGEEAIYFVSDAGGAWNLYQLPVPTEVDHEISTPQRRTNMLTGIFQPSLSSSGRMLFSSFEKGGYDIFLHKNIRLLDDFGPMPEDDQELLPFNRMNSHREEHVQSSVTHEDTANERWRKIDFSDLANFGNEDYEKWMGRDRSRDEIDEEAEKVADTLPIRLTEEGEYIEKPYKLRFSPDMSMALAQYDDLFGFQGVSQVAFSDLLGNHVINLYLNFYQRIEFSNLHLYYTWSGSRIQTTAGMYRYVRYLAGETYNRYYRDGMLGTELDFSYPVSRFNRLQLDTRLTQINRDSLNADEDLIDFDQFNTPVYHKYQKGRFLTSSLAFVNDNTLWGATGPVNGRRSEISYTRGFPVSEKGDAGNDFHTVMADARRYLRINSDMQLALRLSAGASWGDTPQRFFMGGSPAWVNTKYYKADSDTTLNTLRSDFNELYYAVFVQPLRGTALYQREGDRFVMGNAELRFPIIHYLVTGWPLTVGFRDLRGVLFTDFGAAWDKARGYDGVDDDGHLKDLVMSYGWGFRVDIGIALLKMDWAWVSNWDGNPEGPQFVVTLGTDF